MWWSLWGASDSQTDSFIGKYVSNISTLTYCLDEFPSSNNTSAIQLHICYFQYTPNNNKDTLWKKMNAQEWQKWNSPRTVDQPDNGKDITGCSF